MAESKKSFVLYADLIHTVRKMNKEQAGELFLTILSYVNDENPSVDNPIVDLVFEPVKRQLKRDLEKWETTRGKRSKSGHEGGLKSAETRRSKTKQVKANEASASISKQDEANEAVTVSDTVTVNGNGNDTGNVIPLKQPRADALIFPYGVSDEFMKTWDELVKQPKWKKKSSSALQFSLKILAKYTDEQGIEMMGKAIAGNYQGLVEPSKQHNNGSYQKTGTGSGSILNAWAKSGTTGGTGEQF